jgi:hypothetical protein
MNVHARALYGLFLVTVVLAPVLGQQLDRASLVTAGELPSYPPLALAARVQGTVILSVAVSNGTIAKIQTLPEANELLATAARKNVSTWRFANDVTGEIKVRFVYELEKVESLRPENPEVLMRLPELVRILAKPVTPVRTDRSATRNGTK